MRYDDEWLRTQHGVVTRPRLIAWGNTDHAIRRALGKGELTRLRPGWFALPQAHPDVARAVRAGGSLGCVSALRLHGVWTLSSDLHVRTGHNRPSGIPAAMRCCPGRMPTRVPTVPVDDPITALRSAAICCDDLELLVILDSMLNQRLATRRELEGMLRDEPRRVQRVLARMDRAESGTETIMRARLRAQGLAVRTQVQIGDVGRVDLLVGESLVIEVDSVAHHTSALAYERDRVRDRRLRALRFVVVRVTHWQVLNDLDAAMGDILEMTSRGDHRRTRRLSLIA